MEQEEEISRGNRTYKSEFPQESITYEEMMNNYLNKRSKRYGKHSD